MMAIERNANNGLLKLIPDDWIGDACLDSYSLVERDEKNKIVQTWWLPDTSKAKDV